MYDKACQQKLLAELPLLMNFSFNHICSSWAICSYHYPLLEILSTQSSTELCRDLFVSLIFYTFGCNYYGTIQTIYNTLFLERPDLLICHFWSWCLLWRVCCIVASYKNKLFFQYSCPFGWASGSLTWDCMHSVIQIKILNFL